MTAKFSILHALQITDLGPLDNVNNPTKSTVILYDINVNSASNIPYSDSLRFTENIFSHV